MLDSYSQSAMDRIFEEIDAEVCSFLADPVAAQMALDAKTAPPHVPFVNVPIDDPDFAEQVREIQFITNRKIASKTAIPEKREALHTTLAKLEQLTISDQKCIEAIAEILNGVGPLTYISFGPHLTKDFDIIMELREPKEIVGLVRRAMDSKIEIARSTSINHVTISRIYRASIASVVELNGELCRQRKKWPHKEIVVRSAAISYRGEPQFNISVPL